MRRRTGKIFMFVLILTVCFTAFSQDYIETRVTKNQVAVGEMFRIEFIANKTCKFIYPDFSDFEVLSGPNKSTQQSMTIINGQMQQEFTIKHNFVLRAKRKGTFTVGPCKLSCEDKTYSSQSVSINVSEGNNSSTQVSTNKNWFGRVQTSKSSVYEGEPVVATYKIYSRVNIADLSELKYGNSKGWYKKEIAPKQTLQLEQETFNGKRYYMVELKKDLLFAQHSGDVVVPEFSIDAVFRRSFFESFRDNIQSNDATLKVKPLPVSNKPESFSGAVGQYDFEVELSKESLQVGDALDLKLLIKGKGNLTLFTPKEPEFPETFEVYDPEIKENTKLTYQGISGSVEYNYLIVPQRPGKFEIPALEFTYFDPKKKDYQIIQSQPFNIVVEGDLNASNPTEYAPVKKEIEAQPTFRHIESEALNVSKKEDILYFSSAFWVLTGIPFLLSIAFLFFQPKKAVAAAKKESSEKVVRRRMKKAYNLLDQKDMNAFYGEIINTIYSYLSEKLNIDGSALNKENIKSNLIDLQEAELGQHIVDLLEEVELAQYGGTSDQGSGHEIADKTKDILGEITQKLKNKA